MKQVLVIDTSILCVWLQVPGKTTCGSHDHKWNYSKVKTIIEKYIEQGATIVLPLASLIETGNHIAQADGDIFPIAQRLMDIVGKTLNDESPWAAFTGQPNLEQQLRSLINSWPEQAKHKLSFGDAMIIDVAAFYAKNYAVEILTGDAQLKSFEPAPPNLPLTLIPRRHRK
ncbi:hypothetical protein [Herpetosiphon geysericola]|uniref:PIN domain-containing protein n=1 Tax=Herpetosiphon geysericola TaxID=70996 RepID=A0A0P6YKG5_9CHLR|nr:hypothetical protein [Herpetosiphon geysericola]KPL90264.1 hypothetical protein SE18_06425 [Herpetosiphon geysericola]